MVFKITEIQLENRIIKIIDSFYTNNTSHTNMSLPESDSIKDPNKQTTRRQILSKKYLSNLHN